MVFPLTHNSFSTWVLVYPCLELNKSQLVPWQENVLGVFRRTETRYDFCLAIACGRKVETGIANSFVKVGGVVSHACGIQTLIDP